MSPLGCLRNCQEDLQKSGAWGLGLLLPQTYCAVFGMFLTFSGPWTWRPQRVLLTLKCSLSSALDPGWQYSNSSKMSKKCFMQQTKQKVTQNSLKEVLYWQQIHRPKIKTVKDTNFIEISVHIVILTFRS